MSKIGKISISIPEKVKAVLSGNVLNIEGPLGKKSLNVDLDMFNVDIAEGKEISIKPKKLDQNSKRLWGMNRSLINNAVIGSSKGLYLNQLLHYLSDFYSYPIIFLNFDLIFLV